MAPLSGLMRIVRQSDQSTPRRPVRDSPSGARIVRRSRPPTSPPLETHCIRAAAERRDAFRDLEFSDLAFDLERDDVGARGAQFAADRRLANRAASFHAQRDRFQRHRDALDETHAVTTLVERAVVRR
jgi:hypothetical protein